MKVTKLALTVGFMSMALLGFSSKVNAVEVTHKIELGDTLSGISLKYFGDPTRFDEIAKENNIENPNLIFAGDTVKFDTETGKVVIESSTNESSTVVAQAPQETPEVENVEEGQTPQETATTQEAPQETYGSGSVRDIVRSAAASRGWDTGANWSAIEFIVQHESSWNPTAKNPASTAYGLFQMLVETNSNPAVQAQNGMNYIAGRYGTPTNALAFWQAHHWY